jgi:flagella basal body P-ring formation protein FlgA
MVGWSASLAGLVCAAIGWGADSSRVAVLPADVVVVSLRELANAGGKQVCVGDVATLEGGSAELRQRIARLDLSDPPRPGQRVQVSRAQVLFRIRLAGIETQRFRVEGPDRVSVILGHCKLSEEEVVQAAKSFLEQRLPWNKQDVTIEAQPLYASLETSGARDQIRLQPELPATGTLLGRVRVNVVLTLNGERQSEVPVYFEVKLHLNVAVATRRIEHGEPLGENNVRYERMAIDGQSGYLTDADALAGRRAKRVLAAGQIIPSADAEVPAAEAPIVVKQRDLVKLVARTGPLILTTLGESLQDGHSGDVIRVRNVDSGRVVQGKVVGAALIEVEP